MLNDWTCSCRLNKSTCFVRQLIKSCSHIHTQTGHSKFFLLLSLCWHSSLSSEEGLQFMRPIFVHQKSRALFASIKQSGTCEAYWAICVLEQSSSLASRALLLCLSVCVDWSVKMEQEKRSLLKAKSYSLELFFPPRATSNIAHTQQAQNSWAQLTTVVPGSQHTQANGPKQASRQQVKVSWMSSMLRGSSSRLSMSNQRAGCCCCCCLRWKRLDWACDGSRIETFGAWKKAAKKKQTHAASSSFSFSSQTLASFILLRSLFAWLEPAIINSEHTTHTHKPLSLECSSHVVLSSAYFWLYQSQQQQQQQQWR